MVHTGKKRKRNILLNLFPSNSDRSFVDIAVWGTFSSSSTDRNLWGQKTKHADGISLQCCRDMDYWIFPCKVPILIKRGLLLIMNFLFSTLTPSFIMNRVWRRDRLGEVTLADSINKTGGEFMAQRNFSYFSFHFHRERELTLSGVVTALVIAH